MICKKSDTYKYKLIITAKVQDRKLTQYKLLKINAVRGNSQSIATATYINKIRACCVCSW